MPALGWTLLLVAAPSVGALWPCAPGLSVTYQVERGGVDTGERVTETVEGLDRSGLCRVVQVTLHPDRRAEREAFAYEHLPDRVSYAGYADTPTAFRPPLLRAPLEPGRGWTFQGVAYRVDAVGLRVETPAGRVEGCVRVTEAALGGGARRAEVVYAPGVGRVIRVADGVRWVATKISRPAPSNRLKSAP